MRRIDRLVLRPRLHEGTGPSIGRAGERARSFADGILRKGAGSPDGLAELSASSGQAIPGGAHARMRSFFGADFGDVRIHTDATAGRMADELRADAFTVGSDVYFASGKADFSSPQGLALLGHELTHVLQGRAGLAEEDRDLAKTDEKEALVRRTAGQRGKLAGGMFGATLAGLVSGILLPIPGLGSWTAGQVREWIEENFEPEEQVRLQKLLDAAKVTGTVGGLAAGFFAGPLGPIAHMLASAGQWVVEETTFLSDEEKTLEKTRQARAELQKRFQATGAGIQKGALTVRKGTKKKAISTRKKAEAAAKKLRKMAKRARKETRGAWKKVQDRTKSTWKKVVGAGKKALSSGKKALGEKAQATGDAVKEELEHQKELLLSDPRILYLLHQRDRVKGLLADLAPGEEPKQLTAGEEAEEHARQIEDKVHQADIARSLPTLDLASAGRGAAGATRAESQALQVESSLLSGLRRAPRGRDLPAGSGVRLGGTPPGLRRASRGRDVPTGERTGVEKGFLAGTGVPLQRRRRPTSSGGRRGGYEDVLDAGKRLPGRPLPDDVRDPLEGYFGHDLSDVRVHEGSTAGRLGDQLGAEAFTLGSDVFLPEGLQRNPEGMSLLAHEIAHVEQQREPGTDFTPGNIPRLEKEAESHANRFRSFASEHAVGSRQGAEQAGLLPRTPSTPPARPQAVQNRLHVDAGPGADEAILPEDSPGGTGEVVFVISSIRLRVRSPRKEEESEEEETAQTRKRRTEEEPEESVRPGELSEASRDGFGLDILTKSRLEAFLGGEVGDVRLHVGEAAGRAAEKMEAEAFTVGRNVFFAPGRFDPQSPEGMALLAHELTHVRQQMGPDPQGPEAPTPAALESVALRQEARYLREGGPGAASTPTPSRAASIPMEVRKPPAATRPPSDGPDGVQKADSDRSTSDTDPVDVMMDRYGIQEDIDQETFIDELTERVIDLMKDEVIMEEERRYPLRWS